MPARLSGGLRCGWAREWLVALCAYALLIAPVGCQFQDLLLTGAADPEGLNSASTGLFVNSGSNGTLLLAGRTPGGDEFFVYGDPGANSGVGRVDAIQVVHDGSDSYVVFESGWPVYARGPDGSYVSISYAQGDNPLSAVVTVHDAATGTEETSQVTVDLGQTVQQVAAAIQAATGRAVEVPVAPAGATSKAGQRSLGALLTVVLVATTMAVAVVILGQVLTGVYALVDAAVKATLLMVFWPVFLVSALFNQLSGAIIEIEFLSFPEVFIDLPGPPTIIID